MQKGISLRTYKFIDVATFSILAGVFEYIGVYALKMYEFPYFSLSLFLSLTLICMMRWNYLSLILAIICGGVYCFANDGSVNNYLIYIFGNAFLLLNLLWFIKGKKKIKDKLALTVMFIITGYLSICLGRSLVSMILGESFFPVLLGFLGTETINLVLTLFVVLIARRQKGLFTDQIEYIKEVQRDELKSEE